MRLIGLDPILPGHSSRRLLMLSLILGSLSLVTTGCGSGTAGHANARGLSAPKSANRELAVARAAIIAARATSPRLFSIFPSTIGTRSCLIPDGGLSRPVPFEVRGTCSTRLRVEPGFSGRTTVSFTEAWGERRVGHSPRTQTWQVIEAANLKPVARHSLGVTPPQFN
jgi:hypothetical protein